jgi:hypothetical protein
VRGPWSADPKVNGSNTNPCIPTCVVRDQDVSSKASLTPVHLHSAGPTVCLWTVFEGIVPYKPGHGQQLLATIFSYLLMGVLIAQIGRSPPRFRSHRLAHQRQRLVQYAQNTGASDRICLRLLGTSTLQMQKQTPAHHCVMGYPSSHLRGN